MGERLLVFFPGIARGGCEEYALSVATAAQARGYEVEACFPQCAATSTLADDFCARALPIWDWKPSEMPGRGRGFQLERQQALDILAKALPDRVWLALPWVDTGCGFLAACAAQGVPGLCVWQLASEFVEMDPEVVDGARAALQRGVAWAAVCEQNADSVARSFGCSQDRVAVVHNWVLDPDLVERWRTADRASVRRSVCEEFGLRQDALLVLTPARLCIEQKAQDVLLDAIHRLRPDNTYFLWAGEGEDRKSLEADIRERGLDRSVKLLGRRHDICRLLSASDLVALPSRLEGCPFTVAEALAMGCCLLTTCVGAHPEILTSGIDSIVVPPGEVDALTAHLHAALSDPALRARLSAGALQVAARHSKARMLSTSFELLEAGQT